MILGGELTLPTHCLSGDQCSSSSHPPVQLCVLCLGCVCIIKHWLIVGTGADQYHCLITASLTAELAATHGPMSQSLTADSAAATHRPMSQSLTADSAATHGPMSQSRSLKANHSPIATLIRC